MAALRLHPLHHVQPGGRAELGALVVQPVNTAALPLFMSLHKNGHVEEQIWDEN